MFSIRLKDALLRGFRPDPLTNLADVVGDYRKDRLSAKRHQRSESLPLYFDDIYGVPYHRKRSVSGNANDDDCAYIKCTRVNNGGIGEKSFASGVKICLLLLLAFVTSGGLFAQQLLKPTKMVDVAAGIANITSSENGYDIVIYSSITTDIELTTDDVRIQVSGFIGDITIDNVKIKRTAASAGAGFMRISSNSKVRLLLKGESKWWSDPYDANIGCGQAGLKVNNGCDLTIEAYNGVDVGNSLYISQFWGVGEAAIGSADDGSSHITINSGTITCIGPDDGAGIGGRTGRPGGYITINGGDVYARCNSTGFGGATVNSAAGIGSGHDCPDANRNTYILITGGTVEAHSTIKNDFSKCGAAIGAGNGQGVGDGRGGFGYVIITGGTIRASVRKPWIPGQERNEWSQPTVYYGRDGVAIGGGQPSAKGTVIVLPSAILEKAEGASYHDGGGISSDKWDIGNCDKLFYLNKANCAVGASNVLQHTKKFTARTIDKTNNQNIYVDVPLVHQYVTGVAAKVGVTAGAGVVGVNTTDELNYYTNMVGVENPVFFTDAIPATGADRYKRFEPPFDPATSLEGGESYNQASGGGTGNDVYNVIIPKYAPIATNYNFKLSQPWPPGTGSASSPLTEDEIILDFGTAQFDNTNLLVPGNLSPVGDLTAFSMSFAIGQTGTEWVKIDSVGGMVPHFDLSGPVVSPPSIAGGANLPIGSPDVIKVDLKSRLPVGQHADTLKFVAINPANGQQIVRKAILKVNITKFNAFGVDTYARLTARRPSPNTTSTALPTNSETVQLAALAIFSDIDRIDTVWYSITESPTAQAVTGYGGTKPHETDAGWEKVIFTGANYSEQLGNIPFPVHNAGNTYYIHWYIETQNSYGSHGTISSYEVDTRKPKPELTIVGAPAVSTAPVNVTLNFTDGSTTFRDIIEPTGGTSGMNSMFDVSNATISSITQTAPNHTYNITLTPNGLGDVTLSMFDRQVRDKYSNQNLASNTVVFTLSTGQPMPNFSQIDPVYTTQPSSIVFTVINAGGTTPAYLTGNDALTPISNANAFRLFELVRTSDVPQTSIANISNTQYFDDQSLTPTGPFGQFTVTGGLTEGEYALHIFGDSIRETTGVSIKDTIYRFKVLSIALSPGGLSPGGTKDFGLKNEGYLPITPFVLTLANNGAANASGLSVSLSGTQAWAFDLNSSGFNSNLAAHSQTSFTIRPKSGLPYNPSDPLATGTLYTATVTVKSGAATVAQFNVQIRVTRLPAPQAVIDYVTEEFCTLSHDTAYTIKLVDDRLITFTPNSNDRTPILENWMSDNVYSIAKVDAEGAVGIEQDIFVPRRPAAPKIEKEDLYHISVPSGTLFGVNDSMEYRREGDGSWIDLDTVTSINYDRVKHSLSGLPQGTYFVRYKAYQHLQRFSSHITVITIALISPPVIKREITLPETEGAIFTPSYGKYYVQSQDDFAFSIFFTDGFEHEVKTNRIIDRKQEILKGTPNAAGGYNYLIRRVQEPVTVLVGDPIVANENAGEPSTTVWASKGKIYITSANDDEAQIYAASGAAIERIRLTGGSTESVPVARGAYIVVMSNGRAHKVIVN